MPPEQSSRPILPKQPRRSPWIAPSSSSPSSQLRPPLIPFLGERVGVRGLPGNHLRVMQRSPWARGLGSGIFAAHNSENPILRAAVNHLGFTRLKTEQSSPPPPRAPIIQPAQPSRPSPSACLQSHSADLPAAHSLNTHPSPYPTPESAPDPRTTPHRPSEPPPQPPATRLTPSDVPLRLLSLPSAHSFRNAPPFQAFPRLQQLPTSHPRPDSVHCKSKPCNPHSKCPPPSCPSSPASSPASLTAHCSQITPSSSPRSSQLSASRSSFPSSLPSPFFPSAHPSPACSTSPAPSRRSQPRPSRNHLASPSQRSR